MGCSSGSSFSSMALSQPLQKLSFPKVAETQYLAFVCSPHSTSGVKRRRGRTAQMVAELKACSNHEGKGLTRRTLAALLAISTQAALLNRTRAEEVVGNEHIRLDMIQNLAEKQKMASIMDMPSTLGSEAKPTLSEVYVPVANESASAKGSMMLKVVPFPDEKAVAAENAAEQQEVGGVGLTFLNTLGVVGSGVLGAFYLSERQAKTVSDLALEDAASKLKSREDAMLSLKEQLEGNLLAEKEQALKQSKKAQQERVALLDELTLTKAVTVDLQKQLDSEKSMVQQLEGTLESLQTALKEAEQQSATLEERLGREQGKGQKLENEIKKANSMIKSKEEEIERLRLTLEENEKVSGELSSQLHESTGALSQAKHRIQELEKEINTISKHLSERETAVQDLNGKLAMAFAQGEETERRLASVQQELDYLKVSSRKELEETQNNLSSKEAEVKQLTIRLADASKEAEKNNKVICHLREEVNVLKHRVSEENAAIERLTGELNASSQKLETTKAQVASLSQELDTSRDLKVKLDQRIVGLQMEADANISSLNQALTQEQNMSSQLRKELEIRKKVLDDLKMEATSLDQQNKELEVSYRQLKEELLSSQEAAKVANAALDEQRELTSTTKKQLELSRRAIAEAKENIKLLRKDVERAKAELENVNKEVSLLTQKLEAANGKITSLEAEKALLIESVDEEREVSNSLREKASQVGIALAKLSKEKETSAKRAKKLEGELASTKGEMLRLKKQVTTMDTALEEAKSRVQSVAQNIHLEGVTEISSEMESLKVDLSHMQTSLEHAEKSQAEAEAAIETLQGGEKQNKGMEEAVLASSVLVHEGDN